MAGRLPEFYLYLYLSANKINTMSCGKTVTGTEATNREEPCGTLKRKGAAPPAGGFYGLGRFKRHALRTAIAIRGPSSAVFEKNFVSPTHHMSKRSGWIALALASAAIVRKYEDYLKEFLGRRRNILMKAMRIIRMDLGPPVYPAGAVRKRHAVPPFDLGLSLGRVLVFPAGGSFVP